MELIASYFDGESPLETKIKAIWTGQKFILQESNLDWSTQNIEIDWTASTKRLHVSHKLGSESIIVEDFSEEDALAIGFDMTKRKTSYKLRLAISVFVLTLTTFIGIYASIEPFSYWVANQISAEQEKTIFDNIVPLAYLNNHRCTQWDAQDLIQQFANSIKEKDAATTTVEILNWDMPNAFAFPGQRIYVTQGLLEVLENPEYLLAVLAHEQGHVELKHSVGSTLSSLTKAFFWSIAFGDFSGGFLIDPKLAKDLSEASYSRRHEASADTFAAELLKRQGYDPKALGKALEAIRIASEGHKKGKKESKAKVWMTKILEKWEKYFSTHPELQARIGRIHEEYPETQIRETLSNEKWLFLKAACKTKQ